VEKVPKERRADYKALVNSFGALVLRNGLAAALAFVERKKEKKGEETAEALFLDHLAAATIPGLESIKRGGELPAAVRGLDVAPYMLATREVLKLSIWFRRAAQATFAEM
jgi:CRISPR-associated protein Cmr5